MGLIVSITPAPIFIDDDIEHVEPVEAGKPVKETSDVVVASIHNV